MPMNLNNISLPYPVLGISDDVKPLLPQDAINVNMVSDNLNFIFEITLKFDNHDIQSLIDSKSAEFSCEYECKQTMLRRCERFRTPQFTIIIPRKSVNGRLFFNCYVSVKKEIENYTNSGFNEDYKDASFNMEPGDILVAFPQCHYDADIKYDKLQAAGSFMQIRESSLHNEVFFDISGNKIEVLLPPTLYNLYCNPIVKGSSEILHSSIVMNALTYALINIDNHKETTWAKTIFYRLENEEELSLAELEDVSLIPGLAQKLLKDPYTRLFNYLISTKNVNIEDN